MIPSIIALSQYLLEDLHESQVSIEDSQKEKRPEMAFSSMRLQQDLCDRCTDSRRGESSCSECRCSVGADLPDGPLAHAGGLSDVSVCSVQGVRNNAEGFSSARSTRESHEAAAPPSGGAIANHVESFEQGRVDPTGDTWYPGAHPATVACNSLLRSIKKKFRDLTSSKADEAAANKFLRSNDLCGNWVYEPQHSGEEELFGCLLREIDDFLHPSGEPLVCNIDAIFDRGRVGPGASLGANGVDFYTKLFSSKLSATSYEVYYQYAERCAKVPIWGLAEFNRLSTYGLPSLVCESRVTFVPKDLTQTRSICTEPSLNMFFQLGLGQIITERLKSAFGIDLSRQPQRNVRLARLGSRDGSIVTIDLESASDSLSLRLCDAVFPDWFNYLLRLYRTPATLMRGERVELNMVSTMGNGFTFPLQTMLFSCVVRAVASQMNVKLSRASGRGARWGVFGDDIICPTGRFADRVIRLLTLIGFRVNREKSYTERYSRFRESCGGDFYMGHNVRGVYIKTLMTPQSRYVAINLLNEWSARWKIPLPRTVGYLQDSVRHLAVPPWAPIDSGIRIPNDLTLNRYGLWASVRRGSFVYRYYQAWVPQLRCLEDSIALPRGVYQLRRRMYNPEGLLMSFIGGYVNGSRIPIALKQGERPRYRMKTGIAPFWAPSVEQIRLHGSGFWGWWNTIVPFNLRLTES